MAASANEPLHRGTWRCGWRRRRGRHQGPCRIGNGNGNGAPTGWEGGEGRGRRHCDGVKVGGGCSAATRLFSRRYVRTVCMYTVRAYIRTYLCLIACTSSGGCLGRCTRPVGIGHVGQNGWILLVESPCNAHGEAERHPRETQTGTWVETGEQEIRQPYTTRCAMSYSIPSAFFLSFVSGA